MWKCKARMTQTWNMMALFSIIQLSQHGWSCCGARKSLDVTSRYQIGITVITFFLSFSKNCFHIDLNLTPAVSSGTWNTCFCGSLCLWNVFVVHYNFVIDNSTGLKAVSSSMPSLVVFFFFYLKNNTFTDARFYKNGGLLSSIVSRPLSLPDQSVASTHNVKPVHATLLKKNSTWHKALPPNWKV